MSALARSAYGLDAGPDYPDWRVNGACAKGTYPADWWCSPGERDQARAIWVCLNECAVRITCRTWADQHRPLADQAVYGGIYWTRTAGTNGGNNRKGPVRPAGRQLRPLSPHMAGDAA